MTEKEKCLCNYFEKESKPSDKIFENFNILAATKEDSKESTSVLKCPKCNSYYLLNIHNSVYPNKEVISITKYSPKVDEKIMIDTLNSLEGIITDIELDDYSDLRSTIKKQLDKKNILKPLFNENKN